MLEELQEWFGNAIRSKEYDTDAKGYLTAGPVLTADERLAIYHEQYWLRLLNALKMTFPSVVKELENGFDEEVGIPFLLDHPPHTWSLGRIGEKLPDWLLDRSKNDPSLLHKINASEKHLSIIAALDWAAEIAFWQKQEEPVDFSTWSEDELKNKKLYLQPYITLFALDHDYFAYREGKELVEREGFFIVYRTEKGLSSWKEIDIRAYKLLSLFKNGCSIGAACAEIEGGEEIAFWFKEWTLLRFFFSSSQAQSL